MIIDWSASGHAYAGAAESGDQGFVEPFPQGVLVGVADGLGHGPEAFLAAKRATATAAHYAGAPLDEIVRHCHEALKGTRGVAMSLAAMRVNPEEMAWLGVGNVDGALFRASPAGSWAARDVLLPRPGVVGYRLPPLRLAVLPICPGDTLIFATDGIASGFSDDPPLHCAPQEAADQLLARFAKATDDALVLVARYRGTTP